LPWSRRRRPVRRWDIQSGPAGPLISRGTQAARARTPIAEDISFAKQALLNAAYADSSAQPATSCCRSDLP
jgi:hypothetical protein